MPVDGVRYDAFSVWGPGYVYMYIYIYTYIYIYCIPNFESPHSSGDYVMQAFLAENPVDHDAGAWERGPRSLG